MEKKEKEMVELNATDKTGYYNYERDEFEDEEKVLRAFSEYMRDIEDVEDFDIDNIDIHTDVNFIYWLDAFSIFYIDAGELSFKKENEYGVYDDIKYYATFVDDNDKGVFKLYSNIYDLNYQNEDDVLITCRYGSDIIQYIANEEDVIIKYRNRCFYPNDINVITVNSF